MFYFDGSLLTNYEFPGSSHLDNISAVIGEDAVVKVRLRHQCLRGGGGFSTPDDAVLYTASGRRIVTSKEIAAQFCTGEPVENVSTDGWTGSGWSFLVYKS